MRNKSLTSISLLILFATFTSTVYPFPKDTLCVLGISSGDHLAYSPNGRILAMTEREMVFLLDAQTLIQLGVLMDEADRPVGSYTTKDKAAYWDGTNEHGEKVASGVYYYSICAGDFSDVRKLVLVE